MADVPMMGRIAAGTPVIADQLAELAEDVISLPRMLTGKGSLIALRVAGDSMTSAAIADGDWEATVKTLKKADGHTWLMPHNPSYSPILADTAVIIGKVVSVLRRLL
jgi:repressor LexA